MPFVIESLSYGVCDEISQSMQQQQGVLQTNQIFVSNKQ